MEDLLLWLFLKFLTTEKGDRAVCVCGGGNQGCQSTECPSIFLLFSISSCPLIWPLCWDPGKKPEEMLPNTVLREYITGLTNCIQAKENASAKLDMALVTGTTACSHSFHCRLHLHQYCIIHTVLSYCLQASLCLSFSSIPIQCLQKSVLSLRYWIMTYK